ncbi:MAG: stage 0 sporulation family protein [Clostridiales bacterium]|nr:stage 0 sporulation family protein [Clostridiales bacterium]
MYGIKFDSNKYKVAYYSPCDGVECKQGDRVVAITNRGMEIGEVVNIRRSVKPFEQIVRKATEADDTNAHENRKKAKDAFDVCLKKIRQHNLSMKLTSAYYTLDREKLLFYFTADGRVDFRELVKTLASTFRTRIELRQIGVRDEAKMLGGIGVCGVPLCCSSFLHNFTSVSITMAKEQGLSLNPTKLSGVCGRLMCCLKYEQDSYSELLQKMPGYDAIVETPSGKGVVTGMSVLRGLVKVKLDNNNDGLFTFPIADIKIIKKGRIHFSENSEDIDSIELKLLEKEDSVSE